MRNTGECGKQKLSEFFLLKSFTHGVQRFKNVWMGKSKSQGGGGRKILAFVVNQG